VANVKVHRRVIVDEDQDVPRLAVLTRIVVPPLGNLLGIMLLSLMFWPLAWFDELGRIRALWLCAVGAMLAIPIDFLFRRRRRNQSPVVRWFSPYEGGTLLVVPSWIAGPILAVLLIWVILTHPGP
jgi:hypothetical protein